MAMGFEAPLNWEKLDDTARSASSLDSDFCEIVRPGGGTERYICALLRLPVPEIEAEFQWIVWVSVSDRSWDIYRAGYGIGIYDAKGCFGHLSNSIPDFGGRSIDHATVWFQPDGYRPLVVLHEEDDSLLANAQRNGVLLSQIERWAAIMHRGVADS